MLLPGEWLVTIMRLPRRKFLHLAAGAAVLPAVSRAAPAQPYPTRPVRIIVGFPAGSSSDIVARLMGQWLSQRLGQQFIVDNRPGASGNIGTELALKASPDGYTLLFAVSSNAINAALYDNLNFDFIRDFAPAASVDRVPLVMEVNPAVPATTVPEFIAYAKANPGKLNMASGGNGSPQHVAGELFKMMTGVDMTHVPYKGAAPALTDLLGGQVQVMFDVIVASIEFIRAGKLRPLGVTSTTRLPILPDIPTVDQFVPGYEASVWHGMGMPTNTDPEIITVLNREINAALADVKMTARLADLGAVPMPMTPAEFETSIAEDTAKWAKVIKFAGLKAD
jgi:tripartite-type tricarboxylate transporter receptor subunit TctC